MTRLPDESISFQNTTGDSGVENLYVYGQFNYSFERDDLKAKSIEVSESSTFKSDLIIEGNLSSTSGLNLTGDINIGGASGHVGLATFTDARFYGKLFDGDGDFGTAGQLLSSDGTDLNWIDASTTSVANANNVGTNANSTNADQFITFVGTSSGNNPIRVNSNIKYNPSTNTLSAINIAGSSTSVNLNVTGNLTVGGQFKDGDGNFGTSGQVLSSDGTDTAWINAGSLTAGAAAEVGVSAATANADHFVTMVDTASGNENVRVDTDLKYNPVTNTLTATNFAGSGANLTGIEAFVTGMIILWYGNTGNIPTGFVLCDGNNGTPDLRGKFVAGAGNSDYTPGSTGGNDSITLSESQLPSHNHSLSASTSSEGSHRHFGFANATGGQQRTGSNLSANNFAAKGTGAGNIYETYNITTAGNDASAGKTSQESAHTHSISGSVGNTGSGTAIENRPSYHALCYIMKT